jgi:hypothetical protein
MWHQSKELHRTFDVYPSLSFARELILHKILAIYVDYNLLCPTHVLFLQSLLSFSDLSGFPKLGDGYAILM